MTWPIHKLFENIKTGGSGLVMTPTPGKYLAKLDSVRVGESKNSRRKQVSWYFVVDSQATNHAGETFGVYQGVTDKDGQEDTQGMGNIARYISRLELSPPTEEVQVSEENFHKYLEQAVGSTVRLEVKKGSQEDSRFINIEKLISPPENGIPFPSQSPESPTPSPAPQAIKFAVGDIVSLDNVVYKIKTIINEKQCVGENIQNGGISILETGKCSPAVIPEINPVSQPTTSTEETVELKSGMKIKSTSGKTGTIIKLDEDTGKIYLQDGKAIHEIGVDEVQEVLPSLPNLSDDIPF